MVHVVTVILVASKLLLPCVAVVKGSFTQIKSGFNGDSVKVYAGNPIECAGRCAVHDTCGAFHWDPTQMPRCTIFANVFEKDGAAGTFYGGTILSNGEGVMQTPITIPAPFYPQAEQCADMGHQLILIPTTARDVTIVASHGRITYNVRRDGPTGQMVTYNGAPVDTSHIRRFIAEEAARAYLTDQCFASTHFNLWVMGCSGWGSTSTTTICQYKQP